jgi:hypothetical protein
MKAAARGSATGRIVYSQAFVPSSARIPHTTW